MSTQSTNSLKGRLIIYDSNCKVCSTLKDLLISITPNLAAIIYPLKDLAPELKIKVDAARFKNEMVLLDAIGNNHLYGVHGVLYIFATRSALLAKLSKFRLFVNACNFFYKTLAFNRYIIATPKNHIICDCYPDNVLKYRLSYILITSTLSLLLTAAFGVSLKGFFYDITATKAIVEILLIAGSGWVCQIILALALYQQKALDYIGHLGSIMVVGLLILVPSIVFQFITGLNVFMLPAISVAFSSGYMLYLHINRVKFLNLPRLLNISWFLCLQLTAALWIYFFHFYN